MTSDAEQAPKHRASRLAALQLGLCAVMGLLATFFVIMNNDPPERELDHDGIWTLAVSSAFEIFLAHGGDDTMDARIREVWDESLPKSVRRRVSVTTHPRDDRTLVGTIRVVEFLTGAFFLGFEREGEEKDRLTYFSESGDEVELEAAVLEATDQTAHYIYWRELNPPVE